MAYLINIENLSDNRVEYIGSYGDKDRAFDVMTSLLVENHGDMQVTIRNTDTNRIIATEQGYIDI